MGIIYVMDIYIHSSMKNFNMVKQQNLETKKINLSAQLYLGANSDSLNRWDLCSRRFVNVEAGGSVAVQVQWGKKWGFHNWRITNSWLVYSGKSQTKMDDDWGYPHDLPSGKLT